MKHLLRTGGVQHRNTVLLLANSLANAATGLLFWLLLARVAGLSPETIGVGFAVVSIGTALGLVAKGGLDTAIIRHVPDADGNDARRILLWAALLGCSVAAAGALLLALGDGSLQVLPGLDATAWLLAAAIGCLLVTTWLQDAFYMAHADAAATLKRNLVFSAARLLLPLPVVYLALPDPVPLAWALALAGSALAGIVLVAKQPRPEGPQVDRKSFLRSARRNITGSAAEFLPGLVLVPIVLATAGAHAAGLFGIAWTAASLLFLAAAAVSRSALSELTRQNGHPAKVVARGALQSTVLVIPGVAAAIVLAPWGMGLFGADYVAAAPVFVVLAASALAVAPVYLYLSVLRAREPRALVAYPAIMMLFLFALAPLLSSSMGIMGAAYAWLLVNVPAGAWAAWRLVRFTKEVIHEPAPVRGRPYPE